VSIANSNFHFTFCSVTALDPQEPNFAQPATAGFHSLKQGKDRGSQVAFAGRKGGNACFKGCRICKFDVNVATDPVFACFGADSAVGGCQTCREGSGGNDRGLLGGHWQVHLDTVYKKARRNAERNLDCTHRVLYHQFTKRLH